MSRAVEEHLASVSVALPFLQFGQASAGLTDRFQVLQLRRDFKRASLDLHRLEGGLHLRRRHDIEHAAPLCKRPLNRPEPASCH